jgi:predicted nucleotidyltransferase
MRPSESLALHRIAVRDLVARYPTANPRVFGSVLHGTDTELSDIDILVDDLPGCSLFELGGLLMDLKALLGCDVDLVLPGEISTKYRERVLAEARPV